MPNLSTNNSSIKPSSSELILKHFGLIRFLTLALLIFAAFVAFNSYYLIELPAYGKYLELLTSIASDLLNLVFGEASYPFWNTTDLKTDIKVADGAYISVTSDCDASAFYALVLAMILPWPGKIWKRIAAGVIGVALMFLLNISRIATMMLVDIYFPRYFDLMVAWVLPLILAVCALAYFVLWIRISGTHPADN